MWSSIWFWGESIDSLCTQTLALTSESADLRFKVKRRSPAGTYYSSIGSTHRFCKIWWRVVEYVSMCVSARSVPLWVWRHHIGYLSKRYLWYPDGLQVLVSVDRTEPKYIGSAKSSTSFAWAYLFMPVEFSISFVHTLVLYRAISCYYLQRKYLT